MLGGHDWLMAELGFRAGVALGESRASTGRGAEMGQGGPRCRETEFTPSTSPPIPVETEILASGQRAPLGTYRFQETQNNDTSFSFLESASLYSLTTIEDVVRLTKHSS